MEPDKKIVNFRLTKKGRALLEMMAADEGVSLTAMVEILIRDQARQKGIEIRKSTELKMSEKKQK